MLRSSVQTKILKVLPDDRPITAIQIVENLEKCPRGFYPISRTYDQDQDADLRESSIFKSGAARYLCVSKTEGLPNFVVQEIFIINEKYNPPKGFSLINRTADSEHKAWKKKQLCYRLVNLKETNLAITDIIVCSRLKKAPDGFQLAGELNGVTICFKMGNTQDGGTSNPQSPNSGNNRNSYSNVIVGSPTGGPMYPSLSDGDSDNHDYEILKPPASPGAVLPSGPSRPAPRPPLIHQNTLTGGGSMLDGVPFIINPKFLTSATADRATVPTSTRAKSLQQLLNEFDYTFTVERQV